MLFALVENIYILCSYWAAVPELVYWAILRQRQN